MVHPMIELIIAIIIQCSSLQVDADRIEPAVHLKSGSLIGLREQFNEWPVNVFLGIPYAEKPMDDLRFKKPLPPPSTPRSSFVGLNDEDRKKKVYRATQWPPVCPQSGAFHESARSDFMTHRMSEDCLYLNVWSPVVPNEDEVPLVEPAKDVPKDDESLSGGHSVISDKLVPVLFFIHGGGFVAGSASQDTYNATILSAKGNVVVVTINYRLGALGLLYTGCGTAPGNAAFYDQLLALEWVNDNIAYFGGDPSRITIIGESAGSSFVGLHLLSGYSRYLFKNAIMMSGSPLSVIGMSSNKVGLKKSKNLAKLVGCPLKEITETVEKQDANKEDGKVEVLPLVTPAPEVSVDEVSTDANVIKDAEKDANNVNETPNLLKTPDEVIEETLTKIAEDNFKPVTIKREIFTEETFKCLMDVDIKKILASQLDAKLFEGLNEDGATGKKINSKLNLNEMPFLPIYGTEILPDSPLKTFESNSFSKNTSLLIGTVEDEGSLGLLLSGVIRKNNRLINNFNKENAANLLTRYANEYNLKVTTPSDVIKYYFNHINSSDPEYRVYHLIRSFSDALGDSAITCPSNYFSSNFARGSCNNVHNYYFNYKSKSPGIKEKASWCSNDWMGACHWTDLVFLFGLPFRPENSDKFCDLDRLASEEVIKIFTDFARHGSKGVIWPRAEVLQGQLGGGKPKVIPFAYEINPLTPSCSKIKKGIKYDACDILWNSEFE